MAENKLPQPEYRRLGKSGLRVSVPILGAMSFGSDQWGSWVINEDKALPLLKAAWDRGITTWDTANVYSNGESERIIAKAIKKYNIPRHRVVILTKCFGLTHDEPGVRTMLHPELKNTRDYVNQSGLSRAAIFNAVDASLARLETSYIDLLQIHRADLDNASAEETMKALHDLVQSGKVRYIGASSMWTWQFSHYNHVAEMNGWTQFVSMQNQYNLLYREEEREMNKYCNFAGIGLIPWGPLSAGQLARPVNAADTTRAETSKAMGFMSEIVPFEKEILERVEKVAKDKGWKMSQVALAWISGKVTSPIVGFSSPERMEEAIIPGYKLSEEEIKYLEEPYEPRKIKGHT
jgi:aryl-alcohol dehydrogenase-like predicted oxidoreductase